MKLDLMKKQLQKGYDYVFWMDGDSFFTNMNITIEQFTLGGEDFIGTGDNNDIINTCHLLLKNSEWSFKFLDEWIAFRIPLKN